MNHPAETALTRLDISPKRFVLFGIGRTRTDVDPFFARAVCGRRKIAINLLLIGALWLVLVDFGRDERDFGDRRTSGSISAGAPATTVAPAMSAMSLMFFIIYMCECNVPGSLTQADTSRLRRFLMLDQSPIPVSNDQTELTRLFELQ